MNQGSGTETNQQGFALPYLFKNAIINLLVLKNCLSLRSCVLCPISFMKKFTHMLFFLVMKAFSLIGGSTLMGTSGGGDVFVKFKSKAA